MQSTNVRKTQGGARGASLPRHDTGQVPLGAVVAQSRVEGAPAGDDPGMEALVPCFRGDHRKAGALPHRCL
jgi:hypothetical protein